MKKLILLCACMVFLLQARSQVLNPGFEMLDTTNMASHWGPFGYIVMPVDSNCVWTGQDSMQMLTSDAHSGNNAYEIRVATYCDNGYGGTLRTIMFTNVDTFADQREPFTQSPTTFTFWYKFNSVMWDKVLAEAYLEEQDGTPVANGSLAILQSANSWTMGTIHMAYLSANPPEFVRLRFQFMNDTLHYGTRFIVDDINQGISTDVHGIEQEDKLSCYPVPAKDALFVELPGDPQKGVMVLCISDAMGRVIRKDDIQPIVGKRIGVNTANLPQGTYFLKLSTGTNIFTGRFLK